MLLCLHDIFRIYRARNIVNLQIVFKLFLPFIPFKPIFAKMSRNRPKKPRPKLPVSTEERFLDYFKERLIKLVYEHPCIWHENGKVKIFRQSILGHSKTMESWQEIALALKTPSKPLFTLNSKGRSVALT